jgi:nucleoside 2-deoxyribosyltransferase
MPKNEIYLAGKFNFSTKEDIFNWRENATHYLEDSYIINDPARLIEETHFNNNDVFIEPSDEFSAKEIFSSDLYLLNKSNIVLCHLDKGINTLGVWWEIGYAYSQNKLIVLSGNKWEDYYNHPFIIQSCIRFSALNEALGYLNCLNSSIK